MEELKIGFTERGDAAVDLSWADEAIAKCSGVVAITKNPTSSGFWSTVQHVQDTGIPVIVHTTITGWGATDIEPNVPEYITSLESVAGAMSHFSSDRLVLRIDPIFPTAKGLARVRKVLDNAVELSILPKCRCRVSILDEYQHVKERFRSAGWPTCYPGNQFQASKEQTKAVVDMLYNFRESLGNEFRFETCAEPMLVAIGSKKNIFDPCGCLSEKDLSAMSITLPFIKSGFKQRKNCLCLPYKYELLKSKTRCQHQCVYCYWKDT